MNSKLNFVNGIIRDINDLLANPAKVFIICVALGAFAIVYDGSMLRYWSLQKSEKDLQKKISEISLASHQIRSQIEQTKNPGFIERQAREHLDLVSDDEIVFVFSNDE